METNFTDDTSGCSTATTTSARQLESLDDTDCYATAWAEVLRRARDEKASVRWGGRGQGGRGAARKTFQPKDVVVDGVRLEYVGSRDSGSSCRVLLEDATLKLLAASSDGGGSSSGKRRVYGLLGRNGCGKSTLLKRAHAGRIPGFPPHVSTLYVPQISVWAAFGAETNSSASDGEGNDNDESDDGGARPEVTPLQYLLKRHEIHSRKSKETIRREIDRLEDAIEDLDVESEQDQVRIEELGLEISRLEDEYDGFGNRRGDSVRADAEDALSFMGLANEALWHAPMSKLSPGLRKKVELAVTLICPADLVLLDEPANHLDVPGLIQLRRVVSTLSESSTVLLSSHDVDFVNDVVTDIIEMAQLNLYSYSGNYADYLVQKQQGDLHQLRQAVSLEKKRGTMVKTLENLKKQATPRRGGMKKKAKQVESQKKKIEREGLDAGDAKGHRWTQHPRGPAGAKVGSINAVADASSRRGLTTQQLLKMTEKSLRPPPDKAVQFIFENPKSQWGEPLIMALDVGHGYAIGDGADGAPVLSEWSPDIPEALLPKEGLLFDCVDMCIDEGKRYCILGKNGCGKSTLLRILAKLEDPIEGTVKHALNVDVGYLNQQVVEDMVQNATRDAACYDSNNAVSLLASLFPEKSEQEIRGGLTAFGLSPKQGTTNIQYLSGGERHRLCLASMMLRNPQVLVLDEPTSDLDIESVEALVYGLSRWTGTVVMVSHDANFIRSLDANCYVLVDGRLRRVEGGVDTYLRSFA